MDNNITPSLTSRLASRILRLARISRFFDKLTALDPKDPAFTAVIHRQRRRQNHKTPPKRLQKKGPITTISINTFPLYLLPHTATPHQKCLLYLHGGAYIVGPSTIQWQTMYNLAHQSGHDLALLDYPKAPEENGATTLATTHKALEHLLTLYPAEAITLIGDSAGASLALAVALYRRDNTPSDNTLPPLRQAILLSPWLDLTMTHPEIPDYVANDVILHQAGLVACAHSYAADQDLRHPYLSPGLTLPHGLPPTHLFVGTAEMFYPDCRDYAQRAQAANHPTHLYAYPHMPHVWPLFPFPESRQARQQIITLLQ